MNRQQQHSRPWFDPDLCLFIIFYFRMNYGGSRAIMGN